MSSDVQLNATSGSGDDLETAADGRERAAQVRDRDLARGRPPRGLVPPRCRRVARRCTRRTLRRHHHGVHPARGPGDGDPLRVDQPGLLLWLLMHGDQTPASLADALEHQSGLKGLSGTSGDLRDVLAASAAGDGDADLAFEVFMHRLLQEIGSMTASAGGLDLLVFTGGIGECDPAVRSLAAREAALLGVSINEGGNAKTTTDRDISAPGARVRTVVVTASEATEIAREKRRVVGSDA